MKTQYKDGMATFKITVNDGFCSYEYPLHISTKNSIDGVMKKVYKAFDLPFKEGKLIK